MTTTKSWLRMVLGASALATLVACGGDDDDDTGDGVRGGSAGAGARGGSAGAPRGGTGGGGGAAGGMAGAPSEGGEAGVAGEGVGGEAGSSAGEGGGSGEAGGTVQGGAGGEPAAAGGGGEANAGGDDRDVFRPEARAFDEALFDGLVVPEGFELGIYARDMQHARMLETHGEHVYLTRPMQGDVVRFIDANDDGVAEATSSAATGLPNVHGIAFSGSSVFLATTSTVYGGTIDADGDFAGLAPIVENLPDGGQHPYRTLAVGPDNLLYISIGSSCDACQETNPEHATLLRTGLDGGGRTIFAHGLRNTIGFGFHPITNQLWGMDHGSDWRGNDLPPEELNLLESGNDYGWPYCFGRAEIDPIIQDPPGMSKATYCAATEPAVLTSQAHGAPIELVFYDHMAFPGEYLGDAFVALHGSWNRFPPTGYKVVRLEFDDAGEPLGFRDFLTGFLIEGGAAQFGRPAGVTVAPDGALLVSDDENGMIYRVAAEE